VPIDVEERPDHRVARRVGAQHREPVRADFDEVHGALVFGTSFALRKHRYYGDW
jgi:hypothetical protein